MPADLAAQVAEALTSGGALAAHARDELGLDSQRRARPLQAAWASALSFSAGAILPLVAIGVSPASARVAICVAVTLAALALLGDIGARLGGAPPLRAMLRVLAWGAVAMAVDCRDRRAGGHHGLRRAPGPAETSGRMRSCDLLLGATRRSHDRARIASRAETAATRTRDGRSSSRRSASIGQGHPATRGSPRSRPRCVRRRTSRSEDRRTARRSRVSRPRSSPRPPGRSRKRGRGPRDACGSRGSDRGRPDTGVPTPRFGRRRTGSRR